MSYLLLVSLAESGPSRLLAVELVVTGLVFSVSGPPLALKVPEGQSRAQAKVLRSGCNSDKSISMSVVSMQKPYLTSRVEYSKDVLAH